MTFIADLPRRGFSPRQHFAPKYEENFRIVTYSARIVPSTEIAEDWMIEPRSMGDDLGHALWYADPSRRKFSGWSPAWPTVVTQATGPKNLAATQTALTKARFFVQPDAGEGIADDRFDAKEPEGFGFPSWASKFPSGWTGILNAGTDSTQQKDVWHPDFLGLVASNRGAVDFSTRVVDLDDAHVDESWSASLSTFVSVEDIENVQPGQSQIIPGRVVALQLGQTGQGDSASGGMLSLSWGQGAAKHLLTLNGYTGGPLFTPGEAPHHKIGSVRGGYPILPATLSTDALWKTQGTALAGKLEFHGFKQGVSADATQARILWSRPENNANFSVFNRQTGGVGASPLGTWKIWVEHPHVSLPSVMPGLPSLPVIQSAVRPPGPPKPPKPGAPTVIVGPGSQPAGVLSPGPIQGPAGVAGIVTGGAKGGGGGPHAKTVHKAKNRETLAQKRARQRRAREKAKEERDRRRRERKRKKEARKKKKKEEKEKEKKKKEEEKKKKKEEKEKRKKAKEAETILTPFPLETSPFFGFLGGEPPRTTIGQTGYEPPPSQAYRNRSHFLGGVSFLANAWRRGEPDIVSIPIGEIKEEESAFLTSAPQVGTFAAFGPNFTGGWEAAEYTDRIRRYGTGTIALWPPDYNIKKRLRGEEIADPATPASLLFPTGLAQLTFGDPDPATGGMVSGVVMAGDGSGGWQVSLLDDAGVDVGVTYGVGEGGHAFVGKVDIEGRVDPWTYEFSDRTGSDIPTGEIGFRYDSAVAADRILVSEGNPQNTHQLAYLTDISGGVSHTVEDADNNTVLQAIALLRTTSHASHGSVGMGVALDLQLENATASEIETAGRVHAEWLSIAGASEAADMYFSVMVGGALQKHVRLAQVEMSPETTTINLGSASKRWGDIFTDGFIDIDEISAPASPAAGSVRLYATSAKRLYSKDSAGLASLLGGGGKIVKYWEAPLFNGTTSTATAIPFDNTIPQITEGREYASVNVTATSLANRLVFMYSGNGSVSAGGIITTVALFKDATAGALYSKPSIWDSLSQISDFTHSRAVDSTSQVVYRIRIGPSSGTYYPNAETAGNPLFGTTNQHQLYIFEVDDS